ncbi:MAG: LPXTG cell wall anchor domain-containing protein [archaeon]
MKRTLISSTNILFAALMFIMLCSFASANVLANVTAEKTILSTDEVGFIVIEFYNDSTNAEKGFIMRLEAEEGIVFPENDDQRLMSKTIDTLDAKEKKEIKVKIKGATTKNTSANIFTYYGTKEPLSNASGTYILRKEIPVTVKTGVEKKHTDAGEQVNVSFKITNYTKSPLLMLGAETIAPDGFEQKTQTLFVDQLNDNNSAERVFELLAPTSVTGDQKIMLTYGFIDANGPHYFEKPFVVNYTQSNNNILAIIGVIVLVVAGYLFIRKTKEQQNLKGTADKKK